MPPIRSREDGDRIPQTPLFDRDRNTAGYAINKMANGLSQAENRAAFKADESAYIDRFGLTPEQKQAVMSRDWEEMMRLGGNLFYILKISAVDPTPITQIGAAQAGLSHEDFLYQRLGKKKNG
ncbi:extradiol ring-cleavage dioxygenase [Fulvimarina sp. MAC3]|uniref:extradiol ring-cleavage dioxygenase n=1 Tax=Fulvimarina sp. MAC3 TaxID=3148887 RepID=UPI0031FD3D17